MVKWPLQSSYTASGLTSRFDLIDVQRVITVVIGLLASGLKISLLSFMSLVATDVIIAFIIDVIDC